MVEIKNGETYNGVLVNCDVWMNLHLRDVICTSSNADKFWKIKECFIRGNTIKYLRVPEEIAEKVRIHAEKKRQRNFNQSEPTKKPFMNKKQSKRNV